ncbi:MAG: TraR/DksA C4-type zinc finger protein [Actinobacteria bacterium]|nr:TraR/DksA C4-type zinc finger protein [Actinomycetota bacterium]
MPQIDEAQVKARLDERIRQIEERREGLRRGGDGMRDELADYDQHPGDQGTETFVQELDETTSMILDEEEQRVKDARRALDEGRYGICVDCGKEIPTERLEAMPESIRCLDDQRQFEAMLRQRGGDASR